MKIIPISISFTRMVNFLGVCGIIGSLVFVGLELRQSHRIALAAQQQQRAALITEVIGSFSEARRNIVDISGVPSLVSSGFYFRGTVSLIIFETSCSHRLTGCQLMIRPYHKQLAAPPPCLLLEKFE